MSSRAEAGAEGSGGDDVESVRVAEVMEEDGLGHIGGLK